MSTITTKPAEARAPLADEMDEAFAGFVEALGILPPETLGSPDSWLCLNGTDALGAVCGNLARVPVLSEPWG